MWISLQNREAPLRSCAIVLMVLALFTTVTAVPAGDSSDPDSRKKQIERLESDLIREKEQYRKYHIKEKDLLGQLSEIEKEIVDGETVLVELRRKIGEARQDLEKKEKRLSALEEASDRIDERLGKRLVALYKYAKRGYMNILATSRDMDQLRKRGRYLQIIMNRDQVLLKKMLKIEEQHGETVLQAQEKLVVIHRLEASGKKRLHVLKEDQQKKVVLLTKIHKEKEFYETAVKELASAAQNLGETLIELERKPTPTEKEVGEKPLPTGFENRKGALPLPSRGRVLKTDHPLGEKGTTTHKGVYIEGPVGAEVKAVYPGRVDFSGWLKGYGQIVVINHGSRYFSVSAHLSKRLKDVGNTVEEGEIIGFLGQTGSLKGPGLYFELRKGGETLDPLQWLKVR
jgi:septal ring factor EnvC (AmiA/AmiB activator)